MPLDAQDSSSRQCGRARIEYPEAHRLTGAEDIFAPGSDHLAIVKCNDILRCDRGRDIELPDPTDLAPSDLLPNLVSLFPAIN